MTRIGSILPLLFAAAGVAFAAQPTTAPAVMPPSPIQRANADAVSRLYAQIAAESVGGVPVAQIVDRVEGHAVLMNGLAKAEQVGGPRVVGEDFVQIQLQINGSRAAQLVLQAVAVKPEKSPVSVDRLAYLLKDWNGRVFTSTGASLAPATGVAIVQALSTTTSTTSTGSPGIVELKLDVVPKWANETLVASAVADRDGSALRTARAAERSAREQLRAKVGMLALGDATRLGDVAQADDALRAVVDETVETAKIAGVDYRSNGSVEVRIALDGRQLWQAILASR